jgi:hypothetical protein
MNRKSGEETTSKSNERITGGTGGQNRMSIQERTEREVEQTLLGFDRTAPPKPHPDFYARVQARIRNAEVPARPSLAVLIRRPLLVPVALTVMISLNIVAAGLVIRRPDPAAAGRQKEMAVLAEEYGLEPGPMSSYWK